MLCFGGQAKAFIAGAIGIAMGNPGGPLAEFPIA
jgi:hypothetical protein